jgi:hypothetical protein
MCKIDKKINKKSWDPYKHWAKRLFTLFFTIKQKLKKYDKIEKNQKNDFLKK